MLRLLSILVLFLSPFSFIYSAEIPFLDSTVIKMPITKNVSMDESIDSMKLRANALNMKLVAHQPLSEELKARGEKNIRRLEIFQFCEPKIAQEMVKFNINFAAYLPCRITLVEDEQGQGWLVMMDLNVLLKSITLPSPLQELAMKVRDNLKQIMDAGIHGEL